ncbi:MAG: S1 RNA-binding domain-containing protein [Candidatus Izemoplasmatales bacterium]|nr:S1 RNA-binding domain-containing protein [Candidatus Izemoplasmatales bacterium]
MDIYSENKMYTPKVGDIVTGTVVKVNKEEVLVDINYACEGVIYKDYLTLGKLNSAEDILKEGDKIEVKVTQFKKGDESDSLLLSRIDILRNELRAEVRNQLEEGKDFDFKVKKSVKGGLVLDHQGIEAFLPESLIFLQGENENKDDLVGKTIKARIIEISKDRNREKIVVNRKQLVYEELKAAEKKEVENLNVDDIVKVRIERLTDFGAFAKISNHIDGLIHISEVSHYHVKNIDEYLTVGDEVDAKIIKIKGKKISLSLKALQPTPWDNFLTKYKVGDKVQAKVVRKMQYGMLLEVEKEVVGLLNRFDYSWNPQENLAGEVEVGSMLEVEITSIDKKKKQFNLSKKHLEYNPWADLKLKKGELISATVLRTEEKGAVVGVEEVEGFLPIGEISVERINRVEDVLKVDEIITVEVLDFFPKEWKLVVSMKSVQEKKNRAEYETQLKENVSSNQSLADLFKEYKK